MEFRLGIEGMFGIEGMLGMLGIEGILGIEGMLGMLFLIAFSARVASLDIELVSELMAFLMLPMGPCEATKLELATSTNSETVIVLRASILVFSFNCLFVCH